MQKRHPTPDTPDEELVTRTLSDNREYLHIMGRYEAKLMRYVLRIASFSREEAEDVLQETFIKAYQNLNDFDRSFKFSSWIYRIAHNEAINALRKTSRFPTLAPTEQNESVVEHLADSLDLERELDHRLHKERVLAALEALDAKYRNVLVLKFLEEKSYEEISDILQRPVGTVGTLVNRARKQLKKKMEQ